MGPRSVLLVDDEADIREIAAIALGDLAGWRVMLASSGLEALERARSDAPDCVVLDVMMPGMDGPATLEALRLLPGFAETPVIFMTAKNQRAERERFLMLGVAGVVAKPFDPMTLAQELERIVDTCVSPAP